MNRTTGGAWILKQQPWPQGNYLKQLPKLHLLWWKIKKSAAKIKEALEHFYKLVDFEETTFFKKHKWSKQSRKGRDIPTFSSENVSGTKMKGSYVFP